MAFMKNDVNVEKLENELVYKNKLSDKRSNQSKSLSLVPKAIQDLF
jgi:hypothetical protein